MDSCFSCQRLVFLSPCSRTQFGNALGRETPCRCRNGNRVSGTKSFPNRAWERGSVRTVTSKGESIQPQTQEKEGLVFLITNGQSAQQCREGPSLRATQATRRRQWR